jgi:hypothetical protein
MFSTLPESFADESMMAGKTKSLLKSMHKVHPTNPKFSRVALRCFCFKFFVTLAALIVVGLFHFIFTERSFSFHNLQTRLAEATEENAGLAKSNDKMEHDLTLVRTDLATIKEEQDQFVKSAHANTELLTAKIETEHLKCLRANALRSAMARKHIVYTAAGDHSSVSGWMGCDTELSTTMDFSLFVSYYGQDPQKSASLKNQVEATSGIFEFAKGWKMDLLWDAFHNPSYHDFFHDAEYIGIFDDDLTFDVGKLNLLFRIHKSYNLILSAPSLSATRIWASTTHTEGCVLRRGAFIEVSSPVMSVNALKLFFSIWKPRIQFGDGTDHAISCILRLHMGMTDNDYGVIDAVEVANPELRADTGQHEIYSTIGDFGSKRGMGMKKYFEQFPEQFDHEWLKRMRPLWHTRGFGQCEK